MNFFEHCTFFSGLSLAVVLVENKITWTELFTNKTETNYDARTFYYFHHRWHGSSIKILQIVYFEGFSERTKEKLHRILNAITIRSRSFLYHVDVSQLYL